MEELIKKLIGLGYTDEQIQDLIDNDMVEATLGAEDTGDATDSLQNTVNRLVATIDKSYDKVEANSTDISTVTAQAKANESGISANGGEIAKNTIAIATNKTAITEIDAEIKYYKGQILEFNEEKTGTKFEDTTLFTKHIVTDGQAIVGGTDGSITNGSVISHTHTQSGHNHPLASSTQSSYTTNNGYKLDRGHDSVIVGSYGVGIKHTTNGGIAIQTATPTIHSTGGAHNAAWGIKLIKVVYVAVKDITSKEMK